MEQNATVRVVYTSVYGKNELAEKIRRSQSAIEGYLSGLFGLERDSEKVCFEYEDIPVDEFKHTEDYARNINEAYETLRRAMIEAQDEDRESIIGDAYSKATATLLRAAKPPGKLKLYMTLPSRIQSCKIEAFTILSTICTIMQVGESEVELNIAT